jgi:uncharacterized OsmC-like protein
MTDTKTIKRSIERNMKAVSLRPAIGQGTSITRATIVDGCTCTITEGPWRLVADIPKSEGGEDRGPTPGVLGRGALGSCLAIGIVMQAAAKDVPLDAVSVEVQADWDARGYLGLREDIPPGYTQVRVIVHIQSAAPEECLWEVVSAAERFSPYGDVFRRANDIVLDVQIARAAAE